MEKMVMAYDEGLAERIRTIMAGHEEVTEKKMFGGLSFMLHGNYACGVAGTLVVRVGKERHDEVMAFPFTRVMDFTGRPMKGWVYVDPPGYEDDKDLAHWVKLGIDHAISLPPK
jgi:TfoX/Sxy family transcriptional regulator of competence genes